MIASIDVLFADIYAWMMRGANMSGSEDRMMFFPKSRFLVTSGVVVFTIASC